jgi:hypothetical protein
MNEKTMQTNNQDLDPNSLTTKLSFKGNCLKEKSLAPPQPLCVCVCVCVCVCAVLGLYYLSHSTNPIVLSYVTVFAREAERGWGPSEHTRNYLGLGPGLCLEVYGCGMFPEIREEQLDESLEDHTQSGRIRVSSKLEKWSLVADWCSS